MYFRQKKWPGSLKIAKILFNHKNGNVEQLDYYRPIAIDPIICKVFELLIKDKVTYCKSKHLITKAQFVVKNCYSTYKAISKLIDLYSRGTWWETRCSC